MNSSEILATDLMNTVCDLSRTQDPHPGQHDLIRRITLHWKLHQAFLLIRRFYSGSARNELSFWVYAGGEIIEQYIGNRPGAIVEIALNQSPILDLLTRQQRADFQIDNDPVLREKLFMACAPSSEVDPYMCAIQIVDAQHGVIGFLIVPQSHSGVLDGESVNILVCAVRMAFERSSSAYSENDKLRISLSAIAGQLLRISKDASSATKKDGIETADDVLQEFLDYTRTIMKAQKCALFLVDEQGNNLTLERISEEGSNEKSTLHYEQIPLKKLTMKENIFLILSPAQSGTHVSKWLTGYDNFLIMKMN